MKIKVVILQNYINIAFTKLILDGILFAFILLNINKYYTHKNFRGLQYVSLT